MIPGTNNAEDTVGKMQSISKQCQPETIQNNISTQEKN